MPKPRILIIEDDKDARDSLSSFFKEIGYGVATFDRAEKALPTLHEEDYSAVLADYNLPGMDGIEFIRQVKKESPAIPCMIITGEGEVAIAVEALKAGAFNFLEKPFNLYVLEGLIREACEKAQLALEVQRLRRQLDTHYGLTSLIGSSEPMHRLFERIKLAAPTNSTVLLTGESGTGKELVSRSLHQCSHRKDAPFIAINCAALPESLVESELFGHERGAFTGATTKKKAFSRQPKVAHYSSMKSAICHYTCSPNSCEPWSNERSLALALHPKYRWMSELSQPHIATWN